MSIHARCLGISLSGLLALAAAGCDEGKSTTKGTGGTGGEGGAGAAGGSGGQGGAGAAGGSGGQGGSGATGGQGGSGGSPGNIEMIDDMEDGDGSILNTGGRKGAWYTYNDATAAGMQTPAVMMPFEMTPNNPPRGTSAFSANSKGSGFTTWGAGFGFDFSVTGMTKNPYDASKYTGVTFWARIGTGTSAAVRFNVGDKQTTPEGGVCMAAKCSDDFGKDLTLTDQWQQFTIKFSDMSQVGWSMVILPSIDKSALYSVHFQAGAKASFDIWIDDIAFTL